jgi:hypothetical protein
VKTFRTKDDAKKFLAMIEAAKVRGSYVDPSLGRVSFSAYTGSNSRTRSRPASCARRSRMA